jgi:hypothetical protein
MQNTVAGEAQSSTSRRPKWIAGKTSAQLTLNWEGSQTQSHVSGCKKTHAVRYAASTKHSNNRHD